ncbi:hypothetical protein Nepgr_025576 [Nepenthes gracilis]|uniref:Uncharacterized protein n=1 Tax=Nepenthes gracilis TaxID=150966 RepID=A0AAD3T564_NEPGR|nr:hypothetical protein Nepgr_025576 [Nepenthes gracilis]
MVPGVKDITSSLTLAGVDAIFTKYAISNSMAMVIPEPNHRACSPLDGFITVYEVHLKGGLHFPVPMELYITMMALGVPFARLQFNAITYLVFLCIFARYHNKVLELAMVKITFHFTYNLNWIIMIEYPEFVVMSGRNPDFTKSSDASKEEREASKKVVDLAQDPGVATVATSPKKKKKKKRLRKKEGTQRIEELFERLKKSYQTEASKHSVTTVASSSSDDDNAVIASMVKRLRPPLAAPV